MKNTIILASLSLVFAIGHVSGAPAKAVDTPPSPQVQAQAQASAGTAPKGMPNTAPDKASVEELLKLSGVPELLVSMRGEFERMMKTSMDEAVGDKELDAEERRLLDAYTKTVTEVLIDELGWEKTKGLYMQVYGENFTQEEIDGLIVFYRSPAGKALAKKLPIVTQRSMALMQERMGPIMEKIEKAGQQPLKDFHAYGLKKAMAQLKAAAADDDVEIEVEDDDAVDTPAPSPREPKPEAKAPRSK